MFFTSLLFVLTCSELAQAFICPEEKPSFYYADVSSGCQIYHFCENSTLQSMTCPEGEAFDYVTSQCENASKVTCYELVNFWKRKPTGLEPKDEHVISKRHVPISDLQDDFDGPFLKSTIKSRAEVIFGTDGTVISKVIVPMIFKILDHPKPRRDLVSIFYAARRAFAPIKWEMIKQRAFALRRTVFKIPTEYFHRTVFNFMSDTKPILAKLADRYLFETAKRIFSNLPDVLETIRKLKSANYQHAGKLMESLAEFFRTYKKLFMISPIMHINLHSIQKISKDLQPIKTAFLKLMIEYLSRNPKLAVNTLYGTSSILQRHASR